MILFVVFYEGKDLLSKHWDIDENKLFNQLLAGVFVDEIGKNNAVFSRGASAIDMWGMGKDGQTLHIIELKCGDNKGIGVIGETLFYTALIYDTCFNKKPLFYFEKYGNKPDTSDTVALRNGGNKFEKLHIHILAEKYHPLFTDDVEVLIRDNLKNLDLSFDRAKYSYEEKKLIN